MFALLAVILFVLAAFGVHFGEVDILALGLACLAAHLLIGGWPWGAITIGRRNP